MKIDAMNVEPTGSCALRIELQFGLIVRLREVQRLTHLLAAEILGTISTDMDLSNYRGTVQVDNPVYERGGKTYSSITMEAMDDVDLERARAALDVVHDVTELLA